MAQHVFKGNGAPTTTPTRVGQHYVDETNDVHYASVHTTDSTGWQKQPKDDHTHTKSDVSDFSHALGDSSHNADTLANLNSKVSDANLIDTEDSRLSDSRTCDNTFDSASNSRTNLDVYSTSEVDGKVVGLYDHKGAYDASTNTPDLDTTPSGILKGDAYTVSVAGTFYTEPLEVGDVLIADQDDPTQLSHWTRVNKNISFGTTSGTACEGDDSRLSNSRTDDAAIHDNVSSEISALTEKTTPVSGDHILIEDSAASNAKKRIKVGNLPANMKALVVVKQANETLVSSTTLQNDDELSFDILSGESWTFRFVIVASEVSANPNIKLRLGATGGLTGNIEYTWQSVEGSEKGHISDFTTDTGVISLTTTKVSIFMTGAVKATANGTVQLQWAQSASDVDATTVHMLSKLIAHKA